MCVHQVSTSQNFTSWIFITITIIVSCCKCYKYPRSTCFWRSNVSDLNLNWSLGFDPDGVGQGFLNYRIKPLHQRPRPPMSWEPRLTLLFHQRSTQKGPTILKSVFCCLILEIQCNTTIQTIKNTSKKNNPSMYPNWGFALRFENHCYMHKSAL